MRGILTFALAGVCWANGFSWEDYQARRAALRKAVPDGVIVVFGATESERGNLRAGFFQEANFLYLTGWREPGAALVIAANEEALFLPKRNEVRERYTGRKLTPTDPDASTRTGFQYVLAIEDLAFKLKQWPGKIHTLTESGQFAAVKKLAGDREIADISKAIARLRMIKSKEEIALIQRSVDATVDAHKAAWQRAATGLYEYQVAATMSGVYFERGCERHAYPPIVASGPNSVILHYAANKRRMDSGELLLMDVGAECAAYAADITRTIPVNGKFSSRQREIYDVVLGAQKAAIAAARPGLKLTGADKDSLNKVALDYVNSHGKSRTGEPLGKYYLHGLGHHVGLDVHDAFDPDVALAPGMVVTIEPGVYIVEEGFGVRIEDMILITETGARVLSEKLPREPRQIEQALAKRK